MYCSGGTLSLQIWYGAGNRIAHPELVNDFEICLLGEMEKHIEIGVRGIGRPAAIACCSPHAQALDADLLKERERLRISLWIEEVYSRRQAVAARHQARDLKAQTGEIWCDRLARRDLPVIGVHCDFNFCLVCQSTRQKSHTPNHAFDHNQLHVFTNSECLLSRRIPGAQKMRAPARLA